MLYPSIEDYKNAITIRESFATLNYLIPVLDAQGFPVFIAGGPAVVFKMQDSRNKEKFYALKCFTQEQPQRKHHFEEIHKYLKKLDSPYMVDYQYLENELWVDGAEYPVLLMEWIEGITMSREIEELCLAADKKGLVRLTYDFNTMAIWLLKQDFAHGDIKPENLQVTPNGNLKLLDYDGMFVPALTGSLSPELGTAEYRHPKRTEADFNRHLDDFPLLLLALSLLSLQKRPELYEPEHQGDSLLFTADDYTALHKSKHYLFFTREATYDENIGSLFGLLQYAMNIPILELIGLENTLIEINKSLNKIQLIRIVPSPIVKKSDITIFEEIPKIDFSSEIFLDSLSKVNPKDPTWVDDYGVIYSADKKRLIKGNSNLLEYKVRPGTVSICDDAFKWSSKLEIVYLPTELKKIGEDAFCSCKGLKDINLPQGILSIGNGAFYGTGIRTIKLPESLIIIGNSLFRYCKYLYEIILPAGIRRIEHDAFSDCINLSNFNIPIGLHEIGENPFYKCFSLKDIIIDSNHPVFKYKNGTLINTLKNEIVAVLPINSNSHYIVPNGTKKIGVNAFSYCKNIQSLKLPENIENIGIGAFNHCENLREINLPESIKEIGGGAFQGCKNITKLRLPNNLNKIGISTFQSCSSLNEINLPNKLEVIEGMAFDGCISLEKIELPIEVRYLGVSAFEGCSKLEEIFLPQSISWIDAGVFGSCKRLKKISLPPTLNNIYGNTFKECVSLTEICIPPGVKTIQYKAFNSCINLRIIKLPDSLEKIESNVFKDCHKIRKIYIPKGSKGKFRHIFYFSMALRRKLKESVDD